MSGRDHLRLVTGWLTDLANVSAGQAPLADAKTKIAAMASLLAEEFPAGAFTRQSMMAVARACKFFPSYGELCAVLSPWWLERRPPLLAISRDTSTEQQQRNELERAETWRRITPEEVRAKIRAVRDDAKFQPILGHFLGTAIRLHAPQHLGLLPPEWLDAPPTEPAKVVELRKPPA